MTATDYLVLNFNQNQLRTCDKDECDCNFRSQREKVDGAYLEDGLLYFRGEKVMAADEIGVPGSQCGKCSATIAVKLRMLIMKPSRKPCWAFGGVKHRLQFVDQINGANL